MKKETNKKGVFQDSILDLMFKSAPKSLKGKYFSAFVAKLIYFLPFFVLAILPMIFYKQLDWLWIVSVVVMLLLIGPMQYGYIKYYNRLQRNEKPSVFSIFNWDMKQFLPVLFIGLLLNAGYLLGSALLIFPAVMLVGMYSMIMFFIEKYKYDNINKAFMVCSAKMEQKRVSMIFYKIFFWSIFGLLILASVIVATKLQIMYETKTTLVLAVGIGGVVLLWIVFALLAVWYHACNQLYFEKVVDVDTDNKPSKETVVEAEEVKEAKEVKAPAKTTTAKKTTTKAATTAKPKTTTTKATTAKTTSTKTTAAKPKTTTTTKTTAAKSKTTAKK